MSHLHIMQMKDANAGKHLSSASVLLYANEQDPDWSGPSSTLQTIVMICIRKKKAISRFYWNL